MPTRTEIEAEMRRRGMPIPGAFSRSAIEQEMHRRGMSIPEMNEAAPRPPDAMTPEQLPPMTGVDIIPQPGPPAPTPQRNPGLLSQLGQAASGLTGFDQLQQAAQQGLQSSPWAQETLQALGQATGFNEVPQALNMIGGESGATIAGAEGVGRLGGGALGLAFGGPVGAAIGQTAGGMIGAGLGKWIDRLARGEDVTAGEVALEMGASAVPDLLLMGAKPLIKGAQKLASRTSRGVQTSEDLAAQHLRRSPPDLIKPPTQAANDQLWAVVHASGDRLNPDSLRAGLSGMTDQQWKWVMQRARRMDAPPNARINAFGEAVERVMTRIREGKKSVNGLALGELQHVRSQIQKIKMSVKDDAVRDSFEIFQDTIDDAMLDAKNYLNGSKGDYPTLLQAREGFRKLKETEEVADLMWSVTSKSSKGDRLTVNLGRLEDAIDHPKAGMQTKAVDALKRAGSIGEVKEFLKNMEKVDITHGALSSVTGGIGQGLTLGSGIGAAILGDPTGVGIGGTSVLLLANILGSPASRARFNAIVLRNQARTGARTITLPMLATLANAARREALGEQP